MNNINEPIQENEINELIQEIDINYINKLIQENNINGLIQENKINELIQEIEGQIITYKLQAENQDDKKTICYEGRTLSYANWILGLHKDVSPNTTKTVYLYTNVCKKSDDGNDVMYKEYLLVRPDKEIDKDGKTLRTHMEEKYTKDENDLKYKELLNKTGQSVLNTLKEKLNQNETSRNQKVKKLEEIRLYVTEKRKELTANKTTLQDESLEDKLNEIKTELSKQERELRDKERELLDKERELRDKERELRDKEEQRDDIMYSLNTIITATPLPYTNDGREDMVQNTNDGREEMDSREEMVQDTNDNYQRTENIQGGVDDDDNAGPTNEELEELNKELEKLNEELEKLNEELKKLNEELKKLNEELKKLNEELQPLNEKQELLNNKIQELNIAGLEQIITEKKKEEETTKQEVAKLTREIKEIFLLIEPLDPIVSTLKQKIKAHQENFEKKPNKLYEIKIKDFGDDNVQAVNVLNADYIDIGMLYKDVAYMVGEPIEDPVISDTGSDTGSVNVSDIDIDILTQHPPEAPKDKEDEDEEEDKDKDEGKGKEDEEEEDVAYMVGKPPTEDPVIISKRDNTKPTSIGQQPPATSENTSDSDSDIGSDTGRDNVSISDIVTRYEHELPDTNTFTQDPLKAPKDVDINIEEEEEEEDEEEEEEEDEEAFFHDVPPPLIEHLQIIEDQFKSYDDYKNIQDTTINDVQSIIKEYIREPFIKIYTGMSLGDLQPTFIINYLSDALKKKDIEKKDIEEFLIMISHMKESLNKYYNTTDNNEKEILNQLVKKFRKYRGGSVKKQKTKKQKPLRKNNSFRKKRKAKV